MGVMSVVLHHALKARPRPARLKIVRAGEVFSRANQFVLDVVNRGSSTDLRRAVVEVTRRGRTYVVPLKLVKRIGREDEEFQFPESGRVRIVLEMNTHGYEGGGRYKIKIWPVVGKIAYVELASRRPVDAIPVD